MMEYDEMSSQPPAWWPAIEDLIQHENHEEATRMVEDVLSRCRKSGDNAATAQALRAVAMVQLYDTDETKPLPGGVAAAEEALALSRKAKDATGEASALHLMAKFHMGPLGNPEEALRVAGESLAKCRASGNKMAEAYVMNTVARLHQVKGDASEAMRLITECISIFEELDDTRGRISAVQTLFRLHVQSGDRWQVIVTADELVDLHQRLGDAVGEGTAAVLAAQYHMSAGNLQDAVSLARRGAEILKKEGLVQKYGGALLTAASSAVHMGDLEAGRATAKEANEVLKRFNDLGGQAAASCVMANAHREGGEFRKAANRFEEAAMFYGQAKDKLAKANAMRDVAASLGAMLTNEPEIPEDGWPNENFLEPLRAAKMSQSLFMQMQDTDSEAYAFTLQQLSDCHMLNRENPEAIARGKEALRIFERTGNHQGMSSAYGSLAQAVSLKGDNTEALRLAKEGRKLAERSGDQEQIIFMQGFIDEYGPAAAKEQSAAEQAIDSKPGNSGVGKSDNAAYVNGMPVVNYDTFEPRVAKAPPQEETPKQVEGLGRAAKKDKEKVVYQMRWVKNPGAKADAQAEVPVAAPASRKVIKEVRSMGPPGGREVLPGRLRGDFDPSDFEPDDAESFRRPGPMDGYQQRVLASSGGPL